METGHPSTRAVNSGSGNRALDRRSGWLAGYRGVEGIILALQWTRSSLRMQLMSDVAFFARVSQQTLDTLSNRYDTSCNFVLQFYNKYELLIPKGSAATYRT